MRIFNLLSILIVTLVGCGPSQECYYEKVANGVLERCVDGTSYFYSNDEEIKSGIIKEVVEPCPEIEVSHAEVILVMGDGSLIVFFASNGGFLSILGDGSYITTDGKSCNFTVDNGTVVW